MAMVDQAPDDIQEFFIRCSFDQVVTSNFEVREIDDQENHQEEEKKDTSVLENLEPEQESLDTKDQTQSVQQSEIAEEESGIAAKPSD